MPEEIFLVKLKAPSGTLHRVQAQCCEVHGEHLVFLDAQGKLTAMFLMGIVESFHAITVG